MAAEGGQGLGEYVVGLLEGGLKGVTEPMEQRREHDGLEAGVKSGQMEVESVGKFYAFTGEKVSQEQSSPGTDDEMLGGGKAVGRHKLDLSKVPGPGEGERGGKGFH